MNDLISRLVYIERGVDNLHKVRTNMETLRGFSRSEKYLELIAWNQNGIICIVSLLSDQYASVNITFS